MVDYNIYDIYNIKQLEFRLDMKIECVHIYIYIAISFLHFSLVRQDTSDPAVSRCCDEENILEFWN